MRKKYNNIVVLDNAITVTSDNYISLTDMLKAKDGDFFISDWLRNRNTVEYLGIWEKVHNPDFNYGEFATIKSQAGLNNYKICLTNIENLNAVFINEGMQQSDRLLKLNQIAIQQMKILVENAGNDMLNKNKG